MQLITNDKHLQLYFIIAICCISLCFFIATIAYRTYHNQDIRRLKTVYLTLKCNGWCALHFISYALMGFLAPSYWYILIILGFLFEFVEIGISRMFKFVDYAVIRDTLINTSGVIFGVFIRTVFVS